MQGRPVEFDSDLSIQLFRAKKENGTEADRRHVSLLSALCRLFDFWEELEHPV